MNPNITPSGVKNPFTHFCMTIGAIPTSYKHALDYYETLLWLIKYLENTVIPAVDNNAQALEELQGLFVQLQTYVANYFTNLDVQEEINNKLDEMASDGTLQEIIGDYLNANALWGFNNVSSMKSSTNLINGSYAKTLGYYEVNDGGAATYKIRTITNQDVVDEMLIIALEDNTLVAELILDEPKKINVLQVGIKRNVDEDQSTKVQSLFNLDNKYTIYFPSGRYYFTSALTNSKRHDIIGDTNTVTDFDRNINGSRLYFTSIDDNDILIDCHEGGRVSIRDIYLICDNVEITQDRSLISDGTTPVDIFTKTTKNTNVIGISLGDFGNQLINVSVYGCNIGISLNTYNVMENVGVLSCETGIQTKNDNVITNINIQRCERGMVLNGALNNISQVRMDSIRYYGLTISSGATSNNITNFIADICQYGAIEMINTQNNYISGSIGRSGTYYANFEIANVTEPEKACKVYLRNGCHNNKIDIIATKTNVTDNAQNQKLAPCYTFVFGVTGSNNKNNDLSITGQPCDSEITPNNLLSIDNLNQIIKFAGQLSGNLHFQGKTYIFNNINGSFTQYNVKVIKPIDYDKEYALLNSSSNLDMSGHSITNIDELRLGDSTNGWATISRSSTAGNVKVGNMNTSYQRSDAQITGVATPTTSASAANKDYVDTH